MKLTYFVAGSVLASMVVSSLPAFGLEGTRPPLGEAAQQASVRGVPPAESLGSPSDEARYAAREAVSPQAKNYRGGDVIIIGAGTLALILVVILIIVLI